MFIRCTRLFQPKYAAFYLSTTSIHTAKDHYNILGLSHKATQAEIKSAYYNLSKVYHPDKNQGSPTAAIKFRDITEAYEVLGNVRMRRLYDKGVHVSETIYKHPTEDDDPRTKFYRSREHRHRAMGRTPIYDFDEWSKAHYGATFARDMERKRREEFIKDLRMRTQNDLRIERIIFAFMVIVGVIMFATREDYDRDRTLYDTSKNHKTKPS